MQVFSDTHYPLVWCAGACLIASFTITHLPGGHHLALGIAATLGLAALHAWRSRSVLRPILTGALLATLATQIAPAPTSPWRGPDAMHHLPLTVEGQPERHRSGWRFQARSHPTPGAPSERTFRILCPPTECERPPLPGDLLVVDAKITPWDPPDHPIQLDYGAMMLRRGVAARGVVRRVISRDEGGGVFSIERALARQRLGIEERILGALDRGDAAFVLAMVLGSKGLLEPAQRAPFNLTGTSHLLAISGLHLGAIAAILWWLLSRLLRLRPSLVRRYSARLLLALPVSLMMSCYVLMIGAPISARRSLMMLISALGANVLMRRLENLDALAIALLLVVLWRPSIACEPALLLSASATLGILLLARALERGGEESGADRPPRRLHALCAVSGVAWLATSPAVLWMQDELPLLGALLNLVFVPLTSAILFPGMLLGVSGLFVWPEGGAAILSIAARIMTWMHTLAAHVSVLPAASVRPGEFSGALLAAFASCVLMTLLAMSARHRGAIMALLCACALCGAPTLITRMRDRDVLIVDFIPVGQGDATLITFPDGHTLLVDGGGSFGGWDPGMNRVLPHLRWRGIHRVDEVLLTHADVDHMRGLFAIAALATPERFLTDPRQLEVPEHARLMREMSRHGASVQFLTESLTYTRAGVHITLLIPPRRPITERNDMSLTILLRYEGASILLPGDLEREGERWLLDQNLGPVTIMKMGHHGSTTSSSDALLDATRPVAGIASAGKRNRFGHPAASVLERYHSRGAMTWRTDRDGLISVRVDGQGNFGIHRFRGAR